MFRVSGLELMLVLHHGAAQGLTKLLPGVPVAGEPLDAGLAEFNGSHTGCQNGGESCKWPWENETSRGQQVLDVVSISRSSIWGAFDPHLNGGKP